MKWTYDQELLGAIADMKITGESFICLVSEKNCLEHGKRVVAILADEAGNDELKREAMHDLKRIIACCNYFVGIKDVEKWIEEHPIEEQ
jgi:hypothetical protein